MLLALRSNGCTVHTIFNDTIGKFSEIFRFSIFLVSGSPYNAILHNEKAKPSRLSCVNKTKISYLDKYSLSCQSSFDSSVSLNLSQNSTSQTHLCLISFFLWKLQFLLNMQSFCWFVNLLSACVHKPLQLKLLIQEMMGAVLYSTLITFC